jgi:hypothetical protein
VRLSGARVSARVLDHTPRVLSVQNLVDEHGAEFKWNPKDGATLLLHGKLHRLPIKSGVPLLAMPVINT